MKIIIVLCCLFLGIGFIMWKLTNNLHQKYYRMAAEQGCADIYQAIVKKNNYTLPGQLKSAYQEAISSK